MDIKDIEFNNKMNKYLEDVEFNKRVDEILSRDRSVKAQEIVESYIKKRKVRN